jgi:hypothetical protein
MKKKYLSLILLLLLPFVLTACTKGKTTDTTATTNNLQEKQHYQEESAKQDFDKKSDYRGTLANLMKASKEGECTFSKVMETTKITGTAYMDGTGEKTRVDTEITTLLGPGLKEKTIESHMIISEGTTYSWGSEFPIGFKMNFQEYIQEMGATEEKDTQLPETTRQGGNVLESHEYYCMPSKVSLSKFDIPTDIVFTDLNKFSSSISEKAKALEEESGTGEFDAEELKETMCDRCGDITDADLKANCLTNFNCD